MFTINQGFDLNSPQFNFKRDYFATVAELKAANENGFPDHFITNVGGVLYQLTKSNSVDATTGKWRKVSVGGAIGTDSNIAYVNKPNTFTETITCKKDYVSEKGAIYVNAVRCNFINKNSSTNKYLKADALADQSDTKVYNTNGGLTDVSVFAKSADVANTYAKKSETIEKLDISKSAATCIINWWKYGQNSNAAPIDTQKITIGSATTKEAGLMSATDKTKLDGIAANANNYSLPKAAAGALGGIMTGYTTTGKNYKVDVDTNGNAFVNVPWTDTDTKYDDKDCAKLSKDNTFSGSNTFNKEIVINSTIANPAGSSWITLNEIASGLVDNSSNGFIFYPISKNITICTKVEKNNFGITLPTDDDKLNGFNKGKISIKSIGGKSSEYYATDGSIQNIPDISNLATKASLDGYVSNQGGVIWSSSTGNAGDAYTTLYIGKKTNGKIILQNINDEDSNSIELDASISGGRFGRVSIIGSVATTGILDSSGNNLVVNINAINDSGNLLLSSSKGDDYFINLEGEDGTITANKIVKTNGTSTQFLKADGSVDSNSYAKISGDEKITGHYNFSNSIYATAIIANDSNNRKSTTVWNTNGGFTDLSVYAKSSDIVAITDDEINALF